MHILITFIKFAFAFQLYPSPPSNIVDKSQPSVRNFFTKVTPDEFRSQVLSSNTTPSSFIPQVTKKEQKEYQKTRKKQNMRDLHDRRKVKDIAERK